MLFFAPQHINMVELERLYSNKWKFFNPSYCKIEVGSSGLKLSGKMWKLLQKIPSN